MDSNRLEELAGRVARIRQEAEALAEESVSFPAIWRNASKTLASVRMLEINLGLEASTILEKKQ